MPKNDLKLAFVASKKIGNAVLRAKAKRRLRACIFVAKNLIHDKNFQDLKRDFNFAFKRLEVLK